MLIYRTLLGIDALVAAVLGYFFLIGLGDGSVSEFNIGLWLGILVVLAVVVVGGVLLQDRGRLGAAKLLLGTLAVPALLLALFFAALIVANPRWN